MTAYGQIPLNAELGDHVWPAGLMLMYGGTAAPAGWVLCTGLIVPQATYPALFAAIGHTWGGDPGGGNFRLPDMQRRFPIGRGAAGAPNAAGGALGHTHSDGTLAIPPHRHGPGAYVGPAHGHPHDLVMGGHTHHLTGGSYAIFRKGDDAAAHLTSGDTGSDFFSRALDGTINGAPESLALGGLTDYAGADVAGATAAGDPPYLFVNYIVKA